MPTPAPDSPRPTASTDDVPPAVAPLGVVGERPGDWIGPYKLLEIIGAGGFGVVFLAERREPMVQRVALKVIKPGMDSRAVIARFEQERQALAVMDHPHVAKVLDGGMTPSGRPYFVMEHVRGEPITTYCDRQRLTLAQRLELFIAVCDAVQHAHLKGIIHRDLKPTNILVATVSTVAEGRAADAAIARDAPHGSLVKVIDFGVAKAVSHTLTDKTIFTEHGQIIGTPEYMSPEQAEMGATDVDSRTDVYSLGVVLYQLLSGELPFDPATLRAAGYDEVRRIIREVDPPRPSTRLNSVDAHTGEAIATARQAARLRIEAELRRELEWIPLKALRKDRSRRYSSPDTLAADCRRYLKRQPLEAGPETAAYQLRKLLVRNRGLVAAGAAVVLVLAIGVAATLWQAQRARAHASATAKANLFLRGIIKLGDPISARKDAASRATTELADVLQTAEGAVDDVFADDPVVAQLWRAEIGSALLGVQPAERGLEYLRTATAELSRLLGDRHPTTIRWKVQLMRGLDFTGHNREALQLGAELMPIVESAPDESLRAEIERIRAFTVGPLIRLGRHDEVIEDYDRQFEWLASYSEGGQLHTASTMGYAGALFCLGERQRALEIAEQNLRGTKTWAGENHGNTLLVREQIVSFRHAITGTSESPELLRDRQQLASDATRVWGPRYPTTIHWTAAVAVELGKRGRHDEAAAILQDNVTLRRIVFGVDSPDTFWACEQITRELHPQEKDGDFLALCRGRASAAQQFHGPLAWEYVAESIALAYALRGSGDLAAAAQALEVAGDAAGALSPERLALRRTWADTYARVLGSSARRDEQFEFLRKHLATDDRWAGGHFLLGWWHLDRGNPGAAIPSFRRAISESDYADCWLELGLGQALVDSGQIEEGLRSLSKATQVAPLQADTWVRYASALYYRLGRLDEAATAYTRATEIAPDWPTPWIGLAEVRRDQREFEKGLTAVRSALPNVADWAHPFWLEGIFLLGLGRPEESVASFRAAADRSPKWVDYRVWLGAALKASGDIGSAAAVLEEAASGGVADPSLIDGSALVMLGRATEAIDPLRSACTKSPGVAEHWIWMGRALSATGEPTAALVALERGRSVDRNNWMVARDHARCLSQLDDDERSAYDRVQTLAKRKILRPLIEDAIQAGDATPRTRAAALAAVSWLDQSPLALNNAAWLLINVRVDPEDVPAAKAAALAAVAGDPAQWAYLNTLGVAHYRAGEWARAEEILQQSISLGRSQEQPEQPADWAFLAMCQWRLQRPDEARKSADHFLRMAASDKWNADPEIVAWRSEVAEVLR